MLFSLVVPAILAGVGVVLTFQWGSAYRSLSATYECGFPAFGGGRRSIPMYFFLIAVLFLLFDVELLVLLPIAGVRLGAWGGVGFFVFFVALSMGFWYEWRTGAVTQQ